MTQFGPVYWPLEGEQVALVRLNNQFPPRRLPDDAEWIERGSLRLYGQIIAR